MSRRRIALQPTTAAASTPLPPGLDDLLHHVEDRCNRAVAVINVAARAVEGDQLGMYGHDDVQRMLGASLERIAEELTEISDRALCARTGGAA